VGNDLGKVKLGGGRPYYFKPANQPERDKGRSIAVSRGWQVISRGLGLQIQR